MLLGFPSGPEIAHREGTENGRTAGLRAFALKGFEDLFDCVGHGKPQSSPGWRRGNPLAGAARRARTSARTTPIKYWARVMMSRCTFWIAFQCRRSPSRSEEHTSELQSLMRISYAAFCFKKKKLTTNKTSHNRQSNQRSKPHTYLPYHLASKYKYYTSVTVIKAHRPSAYPLSNTPTTDIKSLIPQALLMLTLNNTH